MTQLTPNTAYEIQILAFNQAEQITDSNILYVATSTALMGDIDGDGTLASNDVRQAQSSIVDPRNAALSNLVADLNYDGVIDVFDLALLKRAAQEQMYAGWTEWSLDAPPENAENVETMTEYRYAEKTYQESSEQLGEPWILSDTKNTMSDFGAWSDWQEGEVTASDNREVETMTDTRSEITGYHMYFYCTRRDSTEFIRCYRNFSINGDFGTFGALQKYGEHVNGFDLVVSVDELSNTPVVAPGEWHSGSQCGYNEGNVNGYALTGDDHLWYQGDPVTSSYDVTLYRYRDRTEAISYVYYSVGEFSDWSTAPVEESDTIAVETRTLYRYKG
ncbi:dockerin type I repeat-containing protein [Ruminococcus sp.]|uniref:dockerin type I repeat-containing protein n=1 Tax=Ruminococcus sp. TaxID=41978 RepID=UPI00258A4A2C|nr:dockerin type I repeat-containing protein [Ruminococcus sp.]MCR5022016.1 dockerin type I repeat-containing protein [Ruminococcus sp.]